MCIWRGTNTSPAPTWTVLKNISSLSTIPWPCLGDFNEVLRLDEHDGIGQRSNTQIQGFRDTIDVCMLMDLGYKGRFWTLEKKVVGGTFTRVRLDRALGSAKWSAQFLRASLSHLTTANSDHCPILLEINDQHGEPRKHVFRYETLWGNA